MHVIVDSVAPCPLNHPHIVFVFMFSFVHLSAQAPVGIYRWTQRMLEYYGPILTHVHTKHAGINHYHLQPVTDGQYRIQGGDILEEIPITRTTREVYFIQ